MVGVLNACCELYVEILRGRCPHSRVGLPGTDPEGERNRTLMVDVRTPSSPYSTSSWMTSASPIHREVSPARKPLSDSKVVTLAIVTGWGRFSSERELYRYAEARLLEAFPTLPDRSQFNRSVCYHADLIEACFLQLVALFNA